MKRIRLKNRLLPLLTLAALAMTLLDPTAIWLAALIVLGGAWLTATLWVLSLRAGLELERSLRLGWAQVGDVLEEQFRLLNTGWAPATWVEIRDGSDLPDHFTNRATGVGERNETVWHVQTFCTRRGLFRLGPTHLRSGDPLGVYTLEYTDSAHLSVLVTPPTAPLAGIEVAPGGRSGDGRPQPRTLERSVSAGGVRAYSPGDGLRTIHWPTTARRDDWYVRLLDGMPAGDWRILLDLYAPVQAGSGAASTEEHAIILAASLAARGLDLRRAVGLGINGEPLCWTAARQDGAHRFEMLRALALAQPGRQPLAAALARLGGPDRLPAGTSLVLMTTDPDPAWVEQLLPLTWRSVQPSVLLLDAEAYRQPGCRGEAVQALGRLLLRQGIHYYIIPPELFERPETQAQASGPWRWRFTPHGRAISQGEVGPALTWRRLE